MSNADYARACELVRSLPAETVLRIAGMCDGHGIIDPRFVREAGLPEIVVQFVTRQHRSDGTPKGTVFVDGVPVSSLVGIHGLELLRMLADALQIDYPRAIGRGFEAANIQLALRRHLAPALSTGNSQLTTGNSQL